MIYPMSSSTLAGFATGGYRWMITPEMLQQTPGVWHITTGLFSSEWEPGLTLNISSFMTKCLYWHTKMEMWSTDGCQACADHVFALSLWCSAVISQCLLSQVGEKSTPVQTQCLCNHLTLYGSSFFVLPNDVDISRTADLFATVSQNYVVLALLCAFFGLYLITLLWACYSDRRSRSKVSPKIRSLSVVAVHKQCTNLTSQNNSRTLIYIANINKEQSVQSEEDDSAGGQSCRRSVQLSDQCPNWPS